MQFEEIPADGPPLGILADAEYSERTIDLGRAALYLFSDGATDVREGARCEDEPACVDEAATTLPR